MDSCRVLVWRPVAGMAVKESTWGYADAARQAAEDLRFFVCSLRLQNKSSTRRRGNQLFHLN